MLEILEKEKISKLIIQYSLPALTEVLMALVTLIYLKRENIKIII